MGRAVAADVPQPRNGPSGHEHGHGNNAGLSRLSRLVSAASPSVTLAWAVQDRDAPRMRGPASTGLCFSRPSPRGLRLSNAPLRACITVRTPSQQSPKNLDNYGCRRASTPPDPRALCRDGLGLRTRHGHGITVRVLLLEHLGRGQVDVQIDRARKPLFVSAAKAFHRVGVGTLHRVVCDNPRSRFHGTAPQTA